MKRHAASGRSPEGATSRRGRAFGVPWRRTAIGVLSVIVVGMLLVHAFWFETFTVPSRSMEPNYGAGDRIVVDKRAEFARGDVVVFSGEGSLYQPAERGGVLAVIDTASGWLGFRPDEQDYLKRIIGVGGDHVVVDHKGVLTVNGRRVAEPYLGRGSKRASAQPFSVCVPEGKLFVMGDNRDDSDDSRNHLGDPGGGYVPVDKVVGRVAWKYWSGS